MPNLAHRPFHGTDPAKYGAQAEPAVLQNEEGLLQRKFDLKDTLKLDTNKEMEPWDYVSWATKAAILSELADRTESSEVEARAVVESPVLPHIYKSITPAVLELEPCEQLVFLLDDKHSDVIREATATLSCLSQWVDGAKGVVDAKALDHVLRLLKSPNLDTRESASKLVGRIASHKSTARAVFKLNPSVQLVSLLGGEDSLVPWVTYALSQIAQWVDGVKGVVDAKVLDHVLGLLKSPNPVTQEWASKLVGRVANHKSTAPAVLKLNPSVQLVSLLSGEDSLVHWVMHALSRIAKWVEGAKDVVDAKVLDHVLRLLESPNLDTREWASTLVGWIASHESTAPAVLKLNPSVQLVSLLGGEDSLVTSVMNTLFHIAKWVDGAKGVVDAKVLDHVLRLLESPNLDTRELASKLVGNLTSHKSTAPAVLKLNLSVQLVSLLGGEDSLVPWVTYALSQITRWVDGAKDVVDAKALDHILRLLESPNPDTREWASELVGKVASHESTAPAVLKLNPSVQLVSLLGGEDSLVHSVMYTLSQIAQWVDGAKGVVDAKALDHILRLLESPNPDIRKWASKLVGQVASHESTTPAVLKLNPSVQLVSLLDGEDDLVPSVTYALTQIAQWVDGAKSVVDAKVLDHVLRLLRSPNPDTREQASILVGNLACHESTALAVLKLNPSVQLVSLLGGEDSLVHWVTFALSQIARWVDGAKGVVDAKALDHILRLLESPDPYTQRWASKLVGRVASYKSTAPAVLELEPCEKLVSLLDNKHFGVIREATVALTYLSRWVDGAKGVVDAKALDHVLRLLESPNPVTQEWASQLVAWVTSHESTAPAVLKLNPALQLVSLLG
ncbi:armadillo-type protein [Mycena olivaceomarginata]|nr:armadillo-type protein [Mycena olivaceomarginata]